MLHTSWCYLVRRITEDALYFPGVYAKVVFKPEEYVAMPFDAYLLGDRTAELAGVIMLMMEEIVKEWFPDGFRVKNIVIANWHFPWKRMFDVDYDVKLV